MSSTLVEEFVVDLVCVLRPTVMTWGWRCSCGIARIEYPLKMQDPLSSRASKLTREAALDAAALHAQHEHFGRWRIGVDMMEKR